MKRLTLFATTAFASLALAAPAMADCTLTARSDFSQSLSRVKSSETRDDLQTLYNAANILKRNDKEDACETVVDAMDDLRRVATAERSAAATTADSTDAARATRTADTRNDRDQDAQRIDTTRLRVSKLMGADLIGPNGDEVAEIEDIVLNQRGKDYVIVSFGGFMGLGDDQAAVPLSRVQVVRDGDDVRFKLPMSVKELKSAPRFKKTSQNWFSDDGWWSDNDAYYGKPTNND